MERNARQIIRDIPLDVVSGVVDDRVVPAEDVAALVVDCGLVDDCVVSGTEVVDAVV